MTVRNVIEPLADLRRETVKKSVEAGDLETALEVKLPHNVWEHIREYVAAVQNHYYALGYSTAMLDAIMIVSEEMEEPEL